MPADDPFLAVNGEATHRDADDFIMDSQAGVAREELAWTPPPFVSDWSLEGGADPDGGDLALCL